MSLTATDDTDLELSWRMSTLLRVSWCAPTDSAPCIPAGATVAYPLPGERHMMQDAAILSGTDA